MSDPISAAHIDKSIRLDSCHLTHQVHQLVSLACLSSLIHTRYWMSICSHRSSILPEPDTNRVHMPHRGDMTRWSGPTRWRLLYSSTSQLALDYLQLPASVWVTQWIAQSIPFRVQLSLIDRLCICTGLRCTRYMPHQHQLCLHHPQEQPYRLMPHVSADKC